MDKYNSGVGGVSGLSKKMKGGLAAILVGATLAGCSVSTNSVGYLGQRVSLDSGVVPAGISEVLSPYATGEGSLDFGKVSRAYNVDFGIITASLRDEVIIPGVPVDIGVAILDAVRYNGLNSRDGSNGDPSGGNDGGGGGSGGTGSGGGWQ